MFEFVYNSSDFCNFFNHVSEKHWLGTFIVAVIRRSVSPPIPTSFRVAVHKVWRFRHLWEDNHNIISFSIFVQMRLSDEGITNGGIILLTAMESEVKWTLFTFLTCSWNISEPSFWKRSESRKCTVGWLWKLK